MREIKVLRGIPASGKSTWTKQFLAENPRFKRVNKDSFRRMLIGDNWDVKIEKIVHELQEHAIETLLGKGNSVLLDNTHLGEKYFTEVCNLAKRIGNVTVSEKWFDVPLEECLKRNSTRIGVERVPEDIVRKMYASIEGISKAERTIYFPKVVKTFERNNNLEDCIIVDIDGTLAINTTRSPFEWNRVGEDTVNTPVAEIVKLYHYDHVRVIIFSGRDAICRDETIKWLENNFIPFDELYMRKEKDMRGDDIVKRELFDAHVKGKRNVLFVLDDRDRVVKVWRRDLNLTCLQVAEGNF